MTVPYIEGLTPEQRKQFSQRLLTLHDVLANSADENYEHSWIVRYDMNTDVLYSPVSDLNDKWKDQIKKGGHCGTAACAVGHAVWHHELFPGLQVARDRHDRPVELANGHHSADLYFGPFAWRHIFDSYAYDVHPVHVTRQMAMDRIADYIQNGLGCQLIEDTNGQESTRTAASADDHGVSDQRP